MSDSGYHCCDKPYCQHLWSDKKVPGDKDGTLLILLSHPLPAPLPHHDPETETRWIAEYRRIILVTGMVLSVLHTLFTAPLLALTTIKVLITDF